MIYSNPSFETEKHTHAFGAMLWWIVSLISMFTVGTGVTAIGLLNTRSTPTIMTLGFVIHFMYSDLATDNTHLKFLFTAVEPPALCNKINYCC